MDDVFHWFSFSPPRWALISLALVISVCCTSYLRPPHIFKSTNIICGNGFLHKNLFGSCILAGRGGWQRGLLACPHPCVYSLDPARWEMCGSLLLLTTLSLAWDLSPTSLCNKGRAGREACDNILSPTSCPTLHPRHNTFKRRCLPASWEPNVALRWGGVIFWSENWMEYVKDVLCFCSYLCKREEYLEIASLGETIESVQLCVWYRYS